MREIKFRGQIVDNNVWVYGSYTQMREDDPNEYVNKQGEGVCGRREDAILYEDYLEMINDNPLMMSFDRPAEF